MPDLADTCDVLVTRHPVKRPLSESGVPFQVAFSVAQA
jgi:hypothetical protein